MNGKDKIYLTAQQLGDATIREVTLQMLNNAPDYFWTAPAGDSGQYNPAHSLGEGSLVKQTLVSVKLARSLFENKALYDFSELQQDQIIAALLLHDTCKYGYPEKEEDVVFRHPMMVGRLYQHCWVKDFDEVMKITEMFLAIYTHMGSRNIDKNGRMMMPEPKTEMEKFVHLCDYLASQPFATIGRKPEVVIFVDDTVVDQVAADSPVKVTVVYTNSEYWDETDWQNAVDIDDGPVKISRVKASVDRELVDKYRTARDENKASEPFQKG